MSGFSPTPPFVILHPAYQPRFLSQDQITPPLYPRHVLFLRANPRSDLLAPGKRGPHSVPRASAPTPTFSQIQLPCCRLQPSASALLFRLHLFHRSIRNGNRVRHPVWSRCQLRGDYCQLPGSDIPRTKIPSLPSTSAPCNRPLPINRASWFPQALIICLRSARCLEPFRAAIRLDCRLL